MISCVFLNEYFYEATCICVAAPKAFEGKVISKGSELFKKEAVTSKGNQLGRYQTHLSQNELLFSLDFVNEALAYAYKQHKTENMRIQIESIINFCKDTDNSHFEWYARLLENHLDGIISHAEYPISNGKVEGINQKIKTTRRKSYGLPDDEYFFLKLFDASRQRWRSQIDG